MQMSKKLNLVKKYIKSSHPLHIRINLIKSSSNHSIKIYYNTDASRADDEEIPVDTEAANAESFIAEEEINALQGELGPLVG